MARTGVYKWDVQAARDRLRQQGKNPSIDAVRAELGNTGSKTTIHRYLQELEAEERIAEGGKIDVSEALQALIAPLAERLAAEARQELDTAKAHFEEERQTLQAAAEAARADADGVRQALERTEAARAQLERDKAGLAGQLQAEQLRTAQLVEQSQAQQQRLVDQEAHRQSLEEKHEHARQALEHFRQAAKEQRDQDSRRHEQQVQQLQAEVRDLNGRLTGKLTELTQLNRDAAALTAEIGASRQQVTQLRAEKERAEREAGQARELATRLEAEKAALGQRLEDLAHDLGKVRENLAAREAVVRELELAGVRLQTQLDGALQSNGGLQRQVIHRQKAHEINLRAGPLVNQVADGQRLLREMANYLPDLHEIYKSASDEELTSLEREFPGFALFVDAFEEALVQEQANPSAELQSISELPPELKAEAIELVRKSARIEARYRALVESGPSRYIKQQVLDVSRSERDWLEQLQRYMDALGLQQLPVTTFKTAKAAFAEIAVRIGHLADKLLSQTK